MDDPSLFDEVLQLTMRRHASDVTEEELARLERLLESSPQAIVYYLKIINDSLTVREFVEARTKLSAIDLPSRSELPLDLLTSACDTPTCSLPPNVSQQPTRRPRWQLLAAACAVVAVVATLWIRQAPSPAPANAGSTRLARVVNVSNVDWSDLEHRYVAWSQIAPGDALQFRSGMVNVFIDSGVELLIEGPADVRFASLERIVVNEGRLAARVGPDAIGFSIETPHANVIDRGTVFGISVDSARQTDVVVYEGLVDLDVVHPHTLPRRRMATGEALRVNNAGGLSRIASVQGGGFLPPPQIHIGGAAPNPIIASVNDNIRLNDTAKFNRVIPAGFAEDCRAYVDREHEWNGVAEAGLPEFLVGGDYVMTFNEDKTDTEFEMTVELAQPANVYVLIDNRVPPPEWLARDFVDTGVDIGLDEVHLHVNMEAATGSGKSLDQFYSVWKREVEHGSSVVLGPLGHETYTRPARVVQRGMYGVVATPLRPDRR
jgi:ferric-dicitrate binding protein FerR (iron transport regulator)